MPSNYADVLAFHRKFELPNPDHPTLLDEDTMLFRHKFMLEELREFREAMEDGNLSLAADALVDLVYVAMGTGVMMGLPWQAIWDAVQTANMMKIRAASAQHSADQTGRGHRLDVVKPPGWTHPNIQGILDQHGAGNQA